MSVAATSPLTCWMCEHPSDHLKNIDGTRCMKIYLCSEKCRKLFIRNIVCGGNVDPQRHSQLYIASRPKRLTNITKKKDESKS
jgi:hypothetical protein